MAPDVPIGTLQRIDKRQCNLFSRLALGVADGLLHIPIGEGRSIPWSLPVERPRARRTDQRER